MMQPSTTPQETPVTVDPGAPTTEEVRLTEPTRPEQPEESVRENVAPEQDNCEEKETAPRRARLF